MWMTFRSITADPSVKEAKLKPGTVKRILGYSHKYRSYLFFYLATVVIDAFLIVSTPLLLRKLIDDGVIKASLNPVGHLVDHIVTQVIKAVLVVGAVSDIGTVGGLFFFTGHIGQIDAH